MTANGLIQVVSHGKTWLASGWIALLVALVAAWWDTGGRRSGMVWVVAASLGLLSLLASGFAIGLQGWAFETLTQWWGPMPTRQIGMGLGAVTVQIGRAHV